MAVAREPPQRLLRRVIGFAPCGGASRIIARMRAPSLFVGSSNEARPVAEAVTSLLGGTWDGTLVRAIDPVTYRRRPPQSIAEDCTRLRRSARRSLAEP
jgi:hypothetical protein